MKLRHAHTVLQLRHTSPPVKEAEEEEDREEQVEEEAAAAAATQSMEESQDTCSQELVSSPEDSQSQPQCPVVVGGRAAAAADCAVSALNTSTSVLSAAEKLRRIRKRPRKSKEDLLKQVTEQAAMENRVAQERRENESKRRENESKRRDEQIQLREMAHEHADKLFTLLQLQVETLQRIAAVQEEKQHCGRRPHCQLPSNPSLSGPLSPSGHYQQLPGYYHPRLPPIPVSSPTSPQTQHRYSLHSTPHNKHNRPPQMGLEEHRNSEGLEVMRTG